MKYLIFSLLLFKLSCSDIYRFMDNTTRPKEIINDKRTLTYSKKDNKFVQSASVGLSYVDTLNLFPGEIFRINSDTPYHLVLENIDFSVYTLYSKYFEHEDYVEFGVIRPNTTTIKLDNQCQTIRWMDPYKIPIIEVNEDLEAHQIVLTPLVNNYCQKMGYEIRYGSQDRGCRVQAREVFERYYNCIKKNTKISQRYNLLDIIVE